MRKTRLQDEVPAIPNYREDFRAQPHPPRLIFWHWRMAQRYANCLLIKLLGALLGHKTRIT